MSDDHTILERAFQLARSGRFANLADLTKALKAERFESVEAQLHSPGLRLQLRQLCVAARQTPAD